MKRAIFLAVAAGLFAAATAAEGGPHLSDWSAAQKVDKIGGNHPTVVQV